MIKAQGFDDCKYKKIRKQHHRQVMKEQKKKIITSLLAVVGPMDAATIIQMVADLSVATIQRYLHELLTAGYIRKIHPEGKRGNACAYELLGEYGVKTDMVSRAISHPLHQFILSFVRKAEAPLEVTQWGN